MALSRPETVPVRQSMEAAANAVQTHIITVKSIAQARDAEPRQPACCKRQRCVYSCISQNAR